MSNFVLRATSQRLIAGAFSAVMLVGPAMGQEGAAVPDFSPNSRTGWIAGVPDGVSPIGQDFLQPPSGPGPVTFDKTHPYLDTAAARRAKAQPTLRVADLSNPILRPWVREELRKVNERALTAIVMFTPKERCWPIGVPGFLLYPVTPVYFVQTPKEVVMIGRRTTWRAMCIWPTSIHRSLCRHGLENPLAITRMAIPLLSIRLA